jgi:hypothetical protein
MTTSTIHRGATARPQFEPVAGIPRSGRIRFVTVPDRLCLAIDGDAEPGGAGFRAAIGALFTAAVPLHRRLHERGVEAPMGHLEGLFERRDGRPSWEGDPAAHAPDAWQWTLFIAVPDEATDDDLAAALDRARPALPREELLRLRVVTVREGRVVEALHVGPYDTEAATVERMRAAADAAGLALGSAHHEIWLNDPGRVGPEHTKTVLRLPVR